MSATAFYLGEIYESDAFKKYDQAAKYFDHCFEWDTKTKLNARMRAARLYETKLNDLQKPKELYQEVVTHEIDNKRVEEAQRRLTDLDRKR